MDAYKKAIKATVKEGDVVLDIGCGLGILSFLALRAGASHVHAVEIEPYTYKIAKLVATHNDLASKITFHKKFSTTLKLRSKVDVIVSEIFGNLGLNENTLPVLIDARDRLLKSGGKMIPSACAMWFSPCEHKDWEFTAKALHDIEGLDMLPDNDECDLGTPSVIIKNEELLANPLKFAEVDLMTAKEGTLHNKMKFEIVRDGMLTGFAGWFEAELAKGIGFATNPSNLTTHWKQGFLPLRVPQKVRAGQKLVLELELSPSPDGLFSLIGYHFDIK